MGGRITAFLLSEAVGDLVITTRNSGQFSSEKVVSKNFDFSNTSLDAYLELVTGMDFVIHCACPNEIESKEDPCYALNICALGTQRLLQACIEKGVKRFIYFSTAHVYGAPLQGMIDETRTPRPVHPYAISHRVAEDLVLAAHDKREIEGVVLRLSNAFGCPVSKSVNRWTLLVNDACKQLYATNLVEIYGNPNSLRDFVTLADVCRVTLHFLNLSGLKLSDGLFNVGSGTSWSVRQMAELILSRYRLLENETAMVRVHSDQVKPVEPFFYKIEKLQKTGFVNSNLMDQEIDQLLSFCKNHFVKKNNDAVTR